jgi:hypothetical protein
MDGFLIGPAHFVFDIQKSVQTLSASNVDTMAGTVKWRGPQTGHHTDLNETLLTRGRLLAFPGSFLDCLFCYTSQRSDRSTSPSALASTYQQSVRQGPPINPALVGPPLFSSSRAMQPAKLSLPTLRIATESITCCRGTHVNAAAPVDRHTSNSVMPQRGVVRVCCGPNQ